MVETSVTDGLTKYFRYNGTRAPGLLLILTRIGVPVSTSFSISAFASTFVLEKMLMKSVMGYAVAAVAAYAIWIGVRKILDEAKPVKEEHKKWWRIGRGKSVIGFLVSMVVQMIWQTLLCSSKRNTWDPNDYDSIVFVVGLGFMFP